jgi:hypothetical protein
VAWEREVARRAFYPLTFPLTVGPGSLSVAITIGAAISAQPTVGVRDVVSDLIGVAIVALSVSELPVCRARDGTRRRDWRDRISSSVFVHSSLRGMSTMCGGLADLIRPMMSTV